MSSTASSDLPGAESAKPQFTSPRQRSKAGALGLTSATGLVIGSIIGTGVFTMPFVPAFEAIFSHGAWAGKLVSAVAVASGLGALNGWTLVTAEVSRAPAQDGLFPAPFGWTDRNGTAWFAVLAAAVLPSLLMLWRYTASSGLTVFTYLVALTVVTVAIPYLMSACAQLAYLVSKRRKVHGWLLARDLSVTGAAVLFSMWVTFASGYAAVYEALVIVLVGIVVYAFLKAHREAAGLVAAPAEADTVDAGIAGPDAASAVAPAGPHRRHPHVVWTHRARHTGTGNRARDKGVRS